jgi:glycosyltransferase involved in cell wall biosynthesis
MSVLNPAITVLMPVYNAEKYLREAIDSILAQTFRDFEFLIIDDGSVDSSVDIILSYTDKRIRFVQNSRNEGISATLNKGIELSTTELIARMDADDLCYPGRLETQYKFMQQQPECALLSSAVKVVSSDRRFIRIDNYKSQDFYYNLNFICWIYHPSVVYKKSAVRNSGLYSEHYSEDFDLWWKMSRNYRIGHIPEVLMEYRLSEKSLSSVVKREEYDLSQHQQVFRNIQYYTGNDFPVTFQEIEALRFNFLPLLATHRIGCFILFLKKLKQISYLIARKENINFSVSDVMSSYFRKRDFSIEAIGSALSISKRIWFYFRIREYRRCIYVFKKLISD